jgi:hypothetical protein
MDASRDEWNLTLEVYTKFQLKRKPLGQCGNANLKKNLVKLLEKSAVAKDAELIDKILDESNEYIQRLLASPELFGGYPDEHKRALLLDACQTFEEVKAAYLEQIVTAEPK